MPSGNLSGLFRLVHRLSNWKRWDVIKSLRGWYYSQLVADAGRNLRVSSGVRLNNAKMVSIGDNCYLGSGVQLYPWNERIVIGSDVLVAAAVRMITRKHGFDDVDSPMSSQGYTNAPISIEDDVWIGFGAIILPGVTIGQGSIVGAGAVVTKKVAPYTIVAGVPARPIRKRASPQD
jgi:maltose O-acetyltransferase